MAERRGKQTSRVPYADGASATSHDGPAAAAIEFPVAADASFDPAAFSAAIEHPDTALAVVAAAATYNEVDPAPADAALAPIAAAAEMAEPVEAEPETITPVAQPTTLPAPPVAVAPYLKGFLKMATAPEMTYAATDKIQSMFGDVNERAKTAVEKTSKMAEEFSELAKGNVEAFVASGRVAAKGAEAMTQEVAEYSKKSFESATGALKSFAAVKSPTELFQLQSDYAKSSFESMVAEASKVSESMLKLMGEIAQPLSTRYAVAAEKIKATTSL